MNSTQKGPTPNPGTKPSSANHCATMLPSRMYDMNRNIYILYFLGNFLTPAAPRRTPFLHVWCCIYCRGQGQLCWVASLFTAPGRAARGDVIPEGLEEESPSSSLSHVHAHAKPCIHSLGDCFDKPSVPPCGNP